MPSLLGEQSQFWQGTLEIKSLILRDKTIHFSGTTEQVPATTREGFSTGQYADPGQSNFMRSN